MVLAKDASDGILQKKTKEFAEHLDDFLTELSESLRSGTYEPDPLLSFGIPKGTSGEVRTLHIPSIRDRVVERAVVNTITHRAVHGPESPRADRRGAPHPSPPIHHRRYSGALLVMARPSRTVLRQAPHNGSEPASGLHPDRTARLDLKTISRQCA